MNIFVGHLVTSVTADDLRTAFSAYGTVVNAILVRDTVTNKPLGHAHVYLVPDDAARRAVADLNRVVLRGKPIVVRECIYRVRTERRRHKLPWAGPERRRQPDRRLNGRLGNPS